jgi:predicted transport protein
MAKTSRDYEQEFLDTLKEKTGRDLKTWLGIVRKSSLTKMQETVKWLKAEHGLNHLQATLLAGIYLNDGKPVYGNTGSLLDALFKGKEDKLALYQELEKRLQAKFKMLQVVPTKAYVSFRDKREFACAAITRNEIRVGLDLGDESFGDYVQKAKSLGAMPRISHMIEIRSKSDVNQKLLGYLQKAYDRVHK